MDIKLNFDESRWSKVETDWSNWWVGEIDRPMVILQTLDTTVNADPLEFSTDFMLHKPMADFIQYYQKRLESIQFYGDSYPNWLPYFGPGIVSGFLGGPVKPWPEPVTVWFEVNNPVAYDDLPCAG